MPRAFVAAFFFAKTKKRRERESSFILFSTTLILFPPFTLFLENMSTPGGQSDAMMEDAPPSDQLLFPSSSPVKSVPGSVRRQQSTGELRFEAKTTKGEGGRENKRPKLTSLFQIANLRLFCFQLPHLLRAHPLLVLLVQLLLSVAQCHRVD